MRLEGRNAVVLGLGVTGLSAARWLSAHGARVRVADTRSEPPRAGELRAELPQVSLTTGPLTDRIFAGADLVVTSPGLSKALPPIRAAVERGIELIGYRDLR